MASTVSVSSPADFHVHLRQGAMAALVTPHVRNGGFNLAYVMVRIECALHWHIF
jgi:dihydroorotase